MGNLLGGVNGRRLPQGPQLAMYLDVCTRVQPIEVHSGRQLAGHGDLDILQVEFKL
jgi:hypothetical protein